MKDITERLRAENMKLRSSSACVLGSEQYERFMEALDNPPLAGPKLKALMRRRPLWQK